MPGPISQMSTDADAEHRPSTSNNHDEADDDDDDFDVYETMDDAPMKIQKGASLVQLPACGFAPRATCPLAHSPVPAVLDVDLLTVC